MAQFWRNAVNTSCTFPLFLVMFFVALLATAESASNTAPAPAVDCGNLILNLVDCLPFVTNGTTKKPEGTCCSGLKTVLKTDADCLCQGFKNSAQLGLSINVTKALTLPAACHVSAPSISNCDLSATGGAPAHSPAALSPAGVAGAPNSVLGPNQLAPSPTQGSSGSSALAVSMGFVVLSMLAVVFAALL